MIEIELETKSLDKIKARFQKSTEESQRSVGFAALSHNSGNGITRPWSKIAKKLSGRKFDKQQSFLRSKGNKVTIGYTNGLNHLFPKISDKIEVTPKMRRYFAVMGFPIKKSTTMLNVPGKKTMENVEKYIEFEGKRIFGSKFTGRMNQNAE